MDREAGHARGVAGEVLSRMLVDGGPPWAVLDVVRAEETAGPPTDPNVVHLRISLGEEAGGAEVAAVYFTAGVPREEAVVATAGQLQDHAIEATQGVPLPRCPSHAHPLHPGLRHGLAQWMCPTDQSHHTEPVLGSADQPDQLG